MLWKRPAIFFEQVGELLLLAVAMWSMNYFGANVWVHQIGNAEDVCGNSVKAAASCVSECRCATEWYRGRERRKLLWRMVRKPNAAVLYNRLRSSSLSRGTLREAPKEEGWRGHVLLSNLRQGRHSCVRNRAAIVLIRIFSLAAISYRCKRLTIRKSSTISCFDRYTSPIDLAAASFGRLCCNAVV